MRREFKKKSKVLLIDDNYEHLVGIRELLNLEGTYDVVGIATNVSVGLNLIKKYQPDIVLLDMNMPERDGLQVQDVNRLLDQFEQMKKMMKQMSNGNMKLPF